MQTSTRPLISEELRARLASARRVFVLTGAGVSAESGVPTFRGGGGATTWKGMPFDVISSAEMVARDLPAVWEWFDYRRNALRDLQPNPAHTALARWQTRFEQMTLTTQNVDDLHRAAGSREVLELHGNVWRARCLACSARRDLRELHEEEGETPSRPPVCPECAGQMRPDVVLFGELLPPGVFELAAERAARAEVCFVVGTSALVYPAMRLPEIAHRAGAYMVEINPEPTPLSTLCHEKIQGRAGEVLPEI